MYVQDQCTPLYIASLRGFSEVVKSLLAVNADVNCVCTVSYFINNYVVFIIEDKTLLVSMYNRINET